MNEKVTFLFGAGASCGALPIVNGIPHRIRNLIEFLEKDENQLDDSTYNNLKFNLSKTKKTLQSELIEALRWIMVESMGHASIDTFAKKLFLKGGTGDLRNLKIALSVFFIFEQTRNKPDPRYDAFFASILSSMHVLPERINIISWNYDYQFELSFSTYSDQDDISYNQDLLRVIDKFPDFDKDPYGFCIFKINGSAGFFSDGGWTKHQYSNSLKQPIDINFIDSIVKNYALTGYSTEFEMCLSFAWEGVRHEKSIVNKIIQRTDDTVALVVIGYSFPFFNREVDRKIIGSMTNLKRVYFQDLYPDIIMERFQAIRDDLKGLEMVQKRDVDQFLLPNEL